VSAGQDQTVRFWLLGKLKEPLLTLRGHAGRVRAVALSRAGPRRLAVASGGPGFGEVRLWDVADLLPGEDGD
jgi:WD40 repeat protein